MAKLKIGKKLEFLMKSNLQNDSTQEFICSLAHDFKAPIRQCSAFALLLKDSLEGKLSKEELSLFDALIQSSASSQSMLDALTKYSQWMTSDETIAACSLGKVFKDAMDRNEGMIDKTRAVVNCSEELDRVAVRGKYSQIVFLFSALIDNAVRYIKYDQRRPKLMIEIEKRRDSRLNIRFVDSGCGIQKRYHERMLMLFGKFHEGFLNPGSLGVGLSHCQRIVEIHEGNFSMIDNDSGGLTVLFDLPIDNSNLVE